MATYQTYQTYDSLPTSVMEAADTLVFADYSLPNDNGWDTRAFYSENQSGAIDRSYFSFEAQQGATYDFFSNSYADPETLLVYDLNGDVVAFDQTSNDSTRDIINDFVAPYDGTFYVSAGWVQSGVNNTVSLIIYQDTDTVGSYIPSTTEVDPIAPTEPEDETPSEPVSLGDSISSSDANTLTFEAYSNAAAPEWDERASYSDSTSKTEEDAYFVFSATKGVTYDIFSNSYYDPDNLEVFDQDGNSVAVDMTSDDQGKDSIIDFVAGYTGDYYINAGWVQGSVNKTVSLLVYADNDTATPEEETSSSVDGSNDIEDSLNPDSKSGSEYPIVASYVGGKSYEQNFEGTDGIDTLSFTNYLLGNVVVEQQGTASTNQLVSDTWQVTFEYNGDSKAGPIRNTDTLTEMERIEFDDALVALDLNLDDSAGMALALLYAAFDEMPSADTLGYWINESDALAENNTSSNHMEALAQNMIDYYVPNGASNEDIVTLMYRNVVGTEPSQEGLENFTSLIENGTYSQASLVAFAAASNENTSDYQSAITTGVIYNTDLVM